LCSICKIGVAGINTKQAADWAGGSVMVRYLSVLCILSLAACSSPSPSVAQPTTSIETPLELPPAPAPLPPAVQDQAVSRAVSLLNEWEGDRKVLYAAGKLLIRVIQANPNHAKAHLGLAYFYLDDGYLYGVKFKPGTLDKMHTEIDRAISIDPNLVDAYVLLGYYRYLAGDPEAAIVDLKKAEAMGTSSPLLYLNWADALMSLDRWAEAKEKLQVLQARYDKDSNASPSNVVSLYEKLAELDVFTGAYKDANKAFRRTLEMAPRSAWGHGNYATFLLFCMDDPDGAIHEAQTALDIMDYGAARTTLSAAYYAKWAQFRHTDSNKAAEYFSLARPWSDFSSIMPRAARSVDVGPIIRTMVKELREVGVFLDTPDEDGNTGLTLASSGRRLESVALLLAYGANIEARNNKGQTALSIAADNGYVDVAKALLEHGADVNTRNNSGWTPLLLAAGRGREDMVHLLLSYKADTNLRSHVGATPLMAAASEGYDRIARMLLRAGANPRLEVLNGKETAADFAEMAGHKELATYLRQFKQGNQ
jgi:tetratricopeptide (TPR) repeat protein